MTAVHLQGRVDYYKTFVNETPYVTRFHVIMRKGTTDTSADCPITLDFFVGALPSTLWLPAECNNGQMPFLNTIEVRTIDDKYSAIFSAKNSEYNAIMNANHTLTFAVENDRITMRGSNPNAG